MQLKSLSVIRSGSRISSVDIFRAFAILAVVFYHFNFLPFGYLGVDLFFVISGLLVGGILIRKYKKNEKINFWQFILQRGFKIWPSFYWLLLFGSIVAWLLYRFDKPEYLIEPGKDMLRYVFFYQNYTGYPFHTHAPFDQIWSLCVEEHFYILLPVMFIIIYALFRNNLSMLILSVVWLIIAGIVLKMVSIYFTNSRDTYSGTHNRIDALGWGVLLGICVTYFEDHLYRLKWLPLLFLIGLLIFIINMTLVIYWDNYFFKKVIFQSLTSVSFFLMILGVYYKDFSRLVPLRFVAYYSYNWYLWHSMFVWVIGKYVGMSITGFIVYLIISFGVAMLFTIIIEEPFLKWRGMLMPRIFKLREQNRKLNKVL